MNMPRCTKKQPLVARWIRCAVLGVALSWALGFLHWCACELRWLQRPAHDSHNAELSGEYALENAHSWMYPDLHLPSDHQPRPGVQILNYDMIAYGWPARGLGAWYARVNTWNDNLSARPLIGWDIHPLWSVSKQGDRYERVVPLFPLIGQTIVNAVFWGGAVWIGSICFNRVRRRIRGVVKPCAGCGYELVGIPADRPCPECGKLAGECQPGSGC